MAAPLHRRPASPASWRPPLALLWTTGAGTAAWSPSRCGPMSESSNGCLWFPGFQGQVVGTSSCLVHAASSSGAVAWYVGPSSCLCVQQAAPCHGVNSSS
jgi:hypothetical protein